MKKNSHCSSIRQSLTSPLPRMICWMVGDILNALLTRRIYHKTRIAALPPQVPRSQSASSSKLSSKAPPAVKEAWESAQPKRESHSQIDPGPSKSRQPAASRRTASTSASTSGSESFVLLQDSVVQKIPTHHGAVPSSSKSGSLRPSANSRSSAHNASPQTPRRSSTKQLPAAAANQNNSSSKARNSDLPNGSPSSSRPPSVTNNLHSTLRLFTLLSSRTELDHPICSDCTNVLLESLEKQLEETKRERDGYIAFEREVRKEREAAGSSADEKKMAHRIEKVRGHWRFVSHFLCLR